MEKQRVMNKSIFETEVTFLPSVTCKDEELKKERLSQLLLSERWRGTVEKIRAEADPDKRASLKRDLPAFIPAGVFTKKTADGLQKHSGFICIDIDAKDNARTDNFGRLKEFVYQIPQIAYCGLSVSGTGFFCLIPIADPAKHTDYFRAIESDFKRCGIRIDRKCSNVNRLRFVSYDPAPYINTAARVYDYVLPAKDYSTAQVLGREITGDEAKEKFVAVLREVEATKVDITGDYGQWFEILCAIASTFGEDGRGYAHTISRQAACYDYEETERQYSEILKRNYSYSIGTFFYYAQKEIGQHDFDNITEEDRI